MTTSEAGNQAFPGETKMNSCNNRVHQRTIAARTPALYRRRRDENLLTTAQFEPAQPGEKYSVYYSEGTMNNVPTGRRMSFSAMNVEGKTMQVPRKSFS